MATLGADVDQLDALARDLESGALQLDGWRSRLTNLRAGQWRGQDADLFHREWERSAVRVTAAADGLRSAARDVRRQAEEQRSASAAGSGATVARSAGVPRGASSEAQSVVVGRVWELITAGGTLLEKQNGIREVAEQAPRFKRGLGVLSAVDVAVSAYRTAEEVSSGDYGAAGRDGVDGLGSALRATKNPVAYWAGVNLSVWSVVADEAAKVDYSSKTTSSTLSYAASHPGEVVSELRSAAVQLFPTMVKAFS